MRINRHSEAQLLTESPVAAKVSFVQKIGPYRILRTIAMGGMGEVYLAALEREGGFEKQVALKCVLPRLMTDPRFLEFFEREARLAAVLTHRNIVPVFDFGRDQGRAWLAMEYVHGVDVKAVYDHLEAPLPIGLALEIAIACARALDYAHRARDARGRPLNIIHRDVSPQNILLSFEGDVKLADFGLAQATAREAQEEGTLKGKFAYMSPEQAEGRAVDGRSDQFSLAVVLYELISGCRAFYTEDGAEVILARVGKGEPLRPLGEIVESVPLAIIHVVERALSRDRRDRFADAGRFADALTEAARQNGVTIGQPEVGSWLRALFPSRAISRRSAEKTIESTAVAADPINLVQALEGTQVSDSPVRPSPSPEIGFEHTASAELIRPELTTASPDDEQVEPAELSAPQPEAIVPTVSEPTSREPNSPWLPWVIGALIAGLLTFMIFGQPDDSLGPSPDASPSPSLGAAVTETATRDASVAKLDAAVTPAAADAERPVDAKPVRDAVPPDAAPSRPRDASVRQVKRAAKRKRQRRLRARATSPAEAPIIPQASKAEVDAGAPAATPTPAPDATVAKAPKPPPLSGPRLRVRGGAATIRGSALRNGWFRLNDAATKGRVQNTSGPLIQFRAVIKGGVPWIAFMSKPYGTLFLDGVDSGPTPRLARPLKLGRTRVQVRDEEGKETEFVLELED